MSNINDKIANKVLDWSDFEKSHGSEIFIGLDKSAIDQFIVRLNKIKEVDRSDIATVEPDLGKKSQTISIAQIREFIRVLNLTPIGRYKYGVIYQAEKLNQESANALLKIIEEPPKRVKIIIFYSNEKILPTIKSRCKVHDLRGYLEKVEKSKQIEEVLGIAKKSFAQQSEWIAKNTDSDCQWILEALQSIVRKKMIEERRVVYSRALAELIKAKVHMSQNVNKKLLMENIFLKIQSII